MCSSVWGQKTPEEQVWLQVDFTHFWLSPSASGLPCCSPSLPWGYVLSSKVCINFITGFSGDILVCSHVLTGSGIALTSLKSIFKVLSGAFTCSFVSSSPALQHANIFGSFGPFFNNSMPNLAEMRASQGYPYQRHCCEIEYQCYTNSHASRCPEYELSRCDKTGQAVGFGNYVASKNLAYRGNGHSCPCMWHPFWVLCLFFTLMIILQMMKKGSF